MKSINDIMSADLAVKILQKDEGFSENPYYDTKHIPTYGHGFVCTVNNIQCKPFDELPKVTIALEESLKRLRGLIEVNEKTFLANPDLYSAYKNCNDVRRAVLLSMAHQLGIYGVLKFKGMLHAIRITDWDGASAECLDSQAARSDAPARFKRNAQMLRTGLIHSYYE